MEKSIEQLTKEATENIEAVKRNRERFIRLLAEYRKKWCK